MFSDCPICFESIEENDAAALPCGHVYDRACVRTWVSRSYNCAVCRDSYHPQHIIPLFNTHAGSSEVTENKTSLETAENTIKQQEEEINEIKKKIGLLRLSEERWKKTASRDRTTLGTLIEDFDNLANEYAKLVDVYNEINEKLELQTIEASKVEHLQNGIKKKEDALSQEMFIKNQLKEENISLVRKNKKLDRKNLALKAKNKALNDSIDELTRVEGNPIQLRETKQRAESLEKAVLYLVHEYNKKELDNEELREELEEMNQISDALRDSNKKLEATKKQHENDLQTMTENNTKLIELKDKCLKDLLVLKQKLNVEENQSSNTDKEKLISLEKELAKVKNRRNKLIRESNKYKTKSATLEEENGELKDRLDVAIRILTKLECFANLANS